MYRKSGFLVGLAAAAITFGSLWFTLGPSHFNHGHRSCHQRIENSCMHHPCSHVCNEDLNVQKNEKVIVIKKVIKTDSVTKE
jgi:hypothetical protein